MEKSVTLLTKIGPCCLCDKPATLKTASIFFVLLCQPCQMNCEAQKRFLPILLALAVSSAALTVSTSQFLMFSIICLLIPLQS